MSLIASLLSGGLLGVLGQAAVGVLDEWKAGREHQRKIDEMKLAGELKADAAAWDAFAASQKASEVPSNVPPWCAAVITLFRPFLTLLFFGLAAYGYVVATDAQRANVLDDVNACAFGLAYWWFGSRYQARLRK